MSIPSARTLLPAEIQAATFPVGSTAIRKRSVLSPSCDHRIADGADAARFLAALLDAVEGAWSD